jgi:hypothetical protein
MSSMSSQQIPTIETHQLLDPLNRNKGTSSSKANSSKNELEGALSENLLFWSLIRFVTPARCILLLDVSGCIYLLLGPPGCMARLHGSAGNSEVSKSLLFTLANYCLHVNFVGGLDSPRLQDAVDGIITSDYLLFRMVLHEHSIVSPSHTEVTQKSKVTVPKREKRFGKTPIIVYYSIPFLFTAALWR